MDNNPYNRDPMIAQLMAHPIYEGPPSARPQGMKSQGGGMPVPWMKIAEAMNGGGASSSAAGGSTPGGLSGLGAEEGAAAGGAEGGAGAGMAAFALPLAYAAAIGVGKNSEANHPNTPGGDASLGLLGPSGAQIYKDPVGMGLPAALGVPFITPWTGSQDAKKAKPEFSSFFGLGF